MSGFSFPEHELLMSHWSDEWHSLLQDSRTPAVEEEFPGAGCWPHIYFASKGEGRGMLLKRNESIVRGNDSEDISVGSALTYADWKCSRNCYTVCQKGFCRAWVFVICL